MSRVVGVVFGPAAKASAGCGRALPQRRAPAQLHENLRVAGWSTPGLCIPVFAPTFVFCLATGVGAPSLIHFSFTEQHPALTATADRLYEVDVPSAKQLRLSFDSRCFLNSGSYITVLRQRGGYTCWGRRRYGDGNTHWPGSKTDIDLFLQQMCTCAIHSPPSSPFCVGIPLTTITLSPFSDPLLVDASSCVIKVHTSPDGEDVGWGFRLVVTPVFDEPVGSACPSYQGPASDSTNAEKGHRGLTEASQMLLVTDVLELATAVRIFHMRKFTLAYTHSP